MNRQSGSSASVVIAASGSAAEPYSTTNAIATPARLTVGTAIFGGKQFRDLRADDVHHEAAIAAGVLVQRACVNRRSDRRDGADRMQAVFADRKHIFGAGDPRRKHPHVGKVEIARDGGERLLHLARAATRPFSEDEQRVAAEEPL